MALDLYYTKSRQNSYSEIVSLVIFAVTISFVVQLTSSGKILVNLPGVELSDYRFGLGEPYVAFYERDSYRGQVYFHLLGRRCKNLPESRQNWASSVNVNKRCITVCDELDCTGTCARIYANPENINNKGAPKLSKFGLNDKVKSAKFCYV